MNKRTILFKGKQVDGKGWVEGFPFPVVINNVTRWFLIPCGVDCPKSITIKELQIEVYPETVCQFWKTSKKAGKLFEGDKVKVQGSKRVGVYETEIIFDGTMFTLKENKTAFINSACWVSIIEVIGNIHTT